MVVPLLQKCNEYKISINDIFYVSMNQYMHQSHMFYVSMNSTYRSMMDFYISMNNEFKSLGSKCSNIPMIVNIGQRNHLLCIFCFSTVWSVLLSTYTREKCLCVGVQWLPMTMEKKNMRTFFFLKCIIGNL